MVTNQPQPTPRTAGVLLPVFSLPGPYGIGSFGAAAYAWVDFLQSGGQSAWQLLPLGPTSYGDSPYQSPSAFAGNPYFIDLDMLRSQGLLTGPECVAARLPGTGHVNYEALFQTREGVLRRAFARFTGWQALAAFQHAQAHWLGDYALYAAVKARHGHKPWYEWEDGIRLRRPAAVAAWQKRCAQDITFHSFVQYLFFSQWEALHTYANSRGVRIIGDIPIYVSLDSADVWAAPQWFQLDKDLQPTEVAGVPPDGFSADGQLWGNPLYQWDALQADGYGWWLRRMQSSLALYDVLRIDHFRGFESYYAIPFGSETAAHGRWRGGPGLEFIKALQAALPGADIIAEDLGFLTPAVHQLLAGSGYPGMKVLQFAFGTQRQNPYQPHLYSPHCVAYTGTHDNDTTLGWAEAMPDETVEYAMEYLGVQNKTDLPTAFIRSVYQSPAQMVVAPLQDWLELDTAARVNLPATLGGSNWRWRLPQLPGEALAVRMQRMAAMYGRLPAAQTAQEENSIA